MLFLFHWARAVRALFYTADPRPSELTTGGLLCFVAFPFLAWWINIFAAPSFMIMSMLSAGYEWPWGVLFLSVGLWHVFFNKRLALRCVSAFLTLMCYVFIALLLALATGVSTGTFTYSGLAFICFWQLMRYFMLMQQAEN